MTLLIRLVALVGTGLLLAGVILAMLHGGSIVVNVNALHEGWVEVGLLTVLLAGQVYAWVRRL